MQTDLAGSTACRALGIVEGRQEKGTDAASSGLQESGLGVDLGQELTTMCEQW